MATDAQQQAARREYWIETFAVALGLEDDPFRVHREADLEAMADQAMEVEGCSRDDMSRGEVSHETV